MHPPLGWGRECAAIGGSPVNMCDCLFQVNQVLPATGGMAGMASEAPQGWQEFPGYLAPRALLALLGFVSQPPAPCRLGNGPLAKGPISEKLSATWLSA